ncbi:type II toxin-antitoxin system PemK/MazF family toxin [Candidatus Micrarchaeota archaeon]|nr:type II toxin-antitoxin system PemK/MazF family toxin [Candidatus Micrarchaeota archaeon]
MNQLSVVLVRFPFTNQIDYKIRPALIISNNRFNNQHPFSWVLPITTQETKREFEINIPSTEFTRELKAKSFILTDKIMSMEKHLFLKEIGKITPKLFERVKAQLTKNL